jgi:hypothetical protein
LPGTSLRRRRKSNIGLLLTTVLAIRFLSGQWDNFLARRCCRELRERAAKWGTDLSRDAGSHSVGETFHHVRELCFRGREYADQFAVALAEKAREGVKVHFCRMRWVAIASAVGP